VKSRLSYKIFSAYCVIILLVVMTMGVLITRQAKSRLMEEIKNDLTAQTRIITVLPKDDIQEKIADLAVKSRSRITLINASGTVLADSQELPSELDNHMNRPEIQEARIKGQGEAVRYSHSLGVNMFYIALPIAKGTELTGYVRLARPLRIVENSVAELYQSIFGSMLFIMFFSFLLAFMFARRFIEPIRKVEEFTGKVCRGEDPGTLLVESDNEIGRLAKNINCMVSEYEEKVRCASVEQGKLESAFASMIEGVVVLNGQRRIESMNRGMRKIIAGRYPTDVVGKTPLEAFRNLELQAALERFCETKSPVSGEIRLGEEAPIVLSVNISAIHGLPGDDEKTMMVFHDITRLKKLEKTRTDFIANVTHEIKTPLTAIIGFVDTLREGAIEDHASAKNFLYTIAENARRLDRLVEDLLTISDVEMGDMKLRREGVSVREIVDHVLSIIEAKVMEKNLIVHAHIPESPLLIFADRDRVVQILLNILDNAVKFTPEGGKVTITASEDAHGYVAIRVKDTGIGIPKSELPRIGERFYRVDKARSRELGGTGLGLSIVRHLMRVHEGRMEIESAMGAGTTVSLYFSTYRGEKA
jgi:two-component system phosphate regulon sensor histidine kinase PhoR